MVEGEGSQNNMKEKGEEEKVEESENKSRKGKVRE